MLPRSKSRAWPPGDLDKDPVMGGLHENSSLAELEAELKKHWKRLAPILDLEALVAPSDGIANREVQEG